MRAAVHALPLLLVAPLAQARAAGSPADPANALCRDIAEIVHDAASDFDGDKGAYLTDKEAWVSTVVLPNATGCTIDGTSIREGATGQSTRYSCRWASTGTDDAVATARSIANQLIGCFDNHRDFPVAPLVGGEKPSSYGLYRFSLAYNPPGAGAEFDLSVRGGASRPPTITLTVTSSYRRPIVQRVLKPGERDPNDFDPRVPE